MVGPVPARVPQLLADTSVAHRTHEAIIGEKSLQRTDIPLQLSIHDLDAALRGVPVMRVPIDVKFTVGTPLRAREEVGERFMVDPNRRRRIFRDN